MNEQREVEKRLGPAVTKDLADFVVSTDFNSIPQDVKQDAKLCVLDWLGAALAGSLESPAKIITSIIREMGGSEESTMVGTPMRTSCVNAALANGICGHTVELDDIHEESIIHPAAPVVPAALAVAERSNVSGRDLITSVILGYELEIRIGAAMNPSHYRFWHTTGTCGTFGAAAAAGKILGLDSRRMVNALGIAGTQAAGLVEVFGTMSKSLNAGRAAMDGVLAALLAERGFTSSTAILEAGKGYCQAAAEEYDVNRITENLGTEFKLKNRVFKIHASCGHTHGAIDGILLLARKHGMKPDAVDEILVSTYPIAVDTVGKNYEPKTMSEAKFSLPYCLATALIYGKVGLAEFSEERLTDPKTLTLSRKVRLMVDQEYLNARLGPAKVTLRTTDGEEFSCRVDVPKGYPLNPISKEELEQKFRSLASLALPGRQVFEIVRTVNGLENLNELEPLADLLRKRLP
jgi:2-methylcitrate dehydratase PrpD